VKRGAKEHFGTTMTRQAPSRRMKPWRTVPRKTEERHHDAPTRPGATLSNGKDFGAPMTPAVAGPGNRCARSVSPAPLVGSETNANACGWTYSRSPASAWSAASAVSLPLRRLDFVSRSAARVTLFSAEVRIDPMDSLRGSARSALAIPVRSSAGRRLHQDPQLLFLDQWACSRRLHVI